MTSVLDRIHKERFEQEGYLHLSGFYSSEEAADLIRIYNCLWLKLIASGDIRQDYENPVASLFPRLRDYHLEHEDVLRFMLRPELDRALSFLHDEEVLAVSTSYYYKAPGAKGLPMHQDNYSVGASPGTTCSVWVSLTDSNRVNGGLYLVPRSHKQGIVQPVSVPENDDGFGEELPVPEGLTTIDISASAGDIVLFSGDLFHGSHPNRSEFRFRHAFLTHYARQSVEKIRINHNALLDKDGQTARRKLNIERKIPNGAVNHTQWSGIKSGGKSDGRRQ